VVTAPIPPTLFPAPFRLRENVKTGFVEIGFDSFEVGSLLFDSPSGSGIHKGVETVDWPFAIEGFEGFVDFSLNLPARVGILYLDTAKRFFLWGRFAFRSSP